MLFRSWSSRKINSWSGLLSYKLVKFAYRILKKASLTLPLSSGRLKRALCHPETHRIRSNQISVLSEGSWRLHTAPLKPIEPIQNPLVVRISPFEEKVAWASEMPAALKRVPMLLNLRTEGQTLQSGVHEGRSGCPCRTFYEPTGALGLLEQIISRPGVVSTLACTTPLYISFTDLL